MYVFQLFTTQLWVTESSSIGLCRLKHLIDLIVSWVQTMRLRRQYSGAVLLAQRDVNRQIKSVRTVDVIFRKVNMGQRCSSMPAVFFPPWQNWKWHGLLFDPISQIPFACAFLITDRSVLKQKPDPHAQANQMRSNQKLIRYYHAAIPSRREKW